MTRGSRECICKPLVYNTLSNFKVIFKKHTPKIILLYNYIINQKTNQANLQNYLKWHYDVRLYYRLRLCFIHGAEVEDWLRQSVVGDEHEEKK